MNNGVFTVVANFLSGLGRAQFFLFSIIAGIPAALARPRLIVQQLYSVGVLSMIIIVISGSFVGMVLALQFYRTLQVFGAGESLGRHGIAEAPHQPLLTNGNKQFGHPRTGTALKQLGQLCTVDGRPDGLHLVDAGVGCEHVSCQRQVPGDLGGSGAGPIGGQPVGH